MVAAISELEVKARISICKHDSIEAVVIFEAADLLEAKTALVHGHGEAEVANGACYAKMSAHGVGIGQSLMEPVRCSGAWAALHPSLSSSPALANRSSEELDVTSLRPNFRFDELGKEREGFLPAEIAGLQWNDGGYAFLHDVQLGSAGHLRQGNGHLHLPG